MGRRKFEPTDEERQKVYQLTAAGFRVEEVAKTIYRNNRPVCDKTIRKYFAKELEVARIEAVGAVAAMLFKKAMNGDTASMIFYLKTRGGWQERQQIDHTSSDGSMSQSLPSFTKEELMEALESGLKKI